MLENQEKIKGFAHKHRGEWLFTQTKRFGDTHRAYIVDLEELDPPCSHEKEKVHERFGDQFQEDFIGFGCECGAIVEPSTFVQVNKK